MNNQENTWQQKTESSDDLYTRLSNDTGIPRSVVKNRVFMVLYSSEAGKLSPEELYIRCLQVLGGKRNIA